MILFFCHLVILYILKANFFVLLFPNKDDAKAIFKTPKLLNPVWESPHSLPRRHSSCWAWFPSTRVFFPRNAIGPFSQDKFVATEKTERCEHRTKRDDIKVDWNETNKNLPVSKHLLPFPDFPRTKLWSKDACDKYYKEVVPWPNLALNMFKWSRPCVAAIIDFF